MARVTFSSANGDQRTIEIPSGFSLMEGAIKNDVPGIDADCGGQCACATCHVYVEPAWFDIVGSPNEVEDDMLDIVADRRETSRLSCQIEVSEALDGLAVTTPESQH